MYLWICGSLMSAKNTWVHKSQIAKIYGPQIANLQIYTFEEGPQIYLKKIQVRKFADFRICGFAICGTYLCTTVFVQLNHSCSPSPH
jgi:hypothetical protein